MNLADRMALPCSNCLRRIYLQRLPRPTQPSSSSILSHAPSRQSRSIQRQRHQHFSTTSRRLQQHITPKQTSPLPAHPPQPTPQSQRPVSEETTQTDFNQMDVFNNVPPPASSIESCMKDGFVLSNGVLVAESGMLLAGGEVFRWKPWELDGRTELKRRNGSWHFPREVWGILDLIWPKPDLLVLGVGSTIRPISTETRQMINSFGIRLEVLDTRNAAAQYNLLATERGVHEVAAALLPLGFDLSSQGRGGNSEDDGRFKRPSNGS